MSVSLRVTGSWAELIADGTVAIPPTPQAGDRMYLFARWKDFSVTATVTNWTELEEFADGSSSSGNGTGSVKVACWYRDWQPGDTDPTIDFSAAPENASVVIMVMAKGPDDVWLTPVARTAAMTNWTTTSQSVSASATVAVPSSGVVIGLIGIRDDTAVMTRPTNGIDDAGGLVAWNGNYVESPATHHSTTTGDDGAADLGYRLVTTGAAGVTLRMTGTISAAETGAALWVVQGVSVQMTPGNATLTSSQFAPQLKLAVTPVNASLVSSGFAPQLRLVVTPAASALTLTPSAPLVGMGMVPASATLSTTTFAPTLSLRITPPAATLTLTPFTAQLQETLTPANVSLSVVGFAPIVRMVFTPAAASLTLTPFAPTVVQNILITVPNAALALTTNQPHILPFRLIFLDPGGDAVQAAGYFHAPIAGSTGAVTFDPTQKVIGVGSYKFDSEDGEISAVGVAGILGGVDGAARRISTYFRYDSVPDAFDVWSEFLISPTHYSGGGFINSEGFTGTSDDGVYATTTPPKNSGQAELLSGIIFNIPVGAVIDSVKIIYERKYDVDTSIGISRVKWRVDGEEGPNHDNTDMPLVDTVVEVDVTNDRTWEWQHFFDNRLEIIAEARRGDTDTEHTQSWDYVKIEVVWHAASVILQGRQLSTLGFRVAVKPAGSDVVLRLLDDNDEAYDGITHLAVNEWNRISVSYALVAEDELGINLYVNGIPELSITTPFPALEVPWPLDLEFGWVRIPGANHICWFDQIAVDNGDDLTDIGNILITAKLPATVNENNWDTTGGTGAVNERPLSETNYMQHAAISAVRQTYTLQAAAVGDIDISGETLIGSMGWVWGKVSLVDFLDAVFMVFNNEGSQFATIDGSPSLNYRCLTGSSYPSHAAGIGMISNADIADTFFYEGGAIIAYEGPLHPDLLLPRQLVNNESLATIIDDLRADPPDSYEVCCAFPEFDGMVEITIHSLDQDGGSVSYQGTLNSNGRVRITPGVEVYLDVTVVGVTNLQIWRRLNVD